MTRLLLPSVIWKDLKAALSDKERESCAALIASPARLSDASTDLLARDLIVPSEQEYQRRGPLEAELSPTAVARISRAARSTSSSIVFAHSHPREKYPHFSARDDYGEVALRDFLNRRNPGGRHLALVLGQEGADCRQLGTHTQVSVTSVGSDLDFICDSIEQRVAPTEIHDRQVLALGERSQTLIGSLKIGIVGLGGTGSQIAQQLVHLGVSNFVLIDLDTVEASNLSRLVNATRADVGRSKVSIAAEYVTQFAPNALIELVQGDVIWAAVGRRLLGCDLIFICTDSHGSRAILEQICYQYLIPAIDMGSVITVRGGEVRSISGRVQMLAPGLACLTCSGLLDTEQVRRDMMTDPERRLDRYIVGHSTPEPAVISVNGIVSSLAITMSLSAVAGFPSPARHVLYRMAPASLRSVSVTPLPDCFVCSHRGHLGRGDSWPFPGRQDEDVNKYTTA